MLKVIGRVFDNNQLIGYQVTDGMRTETFDKRLAWLYAKNKQLINVIAIGNEDEPSISGTNGFELKQLPEIKYQEKSLKYTNADIIAAFIRNIVETNNLDNINKLKSTDYRVQIIRNDVERGILNKINYRSKSNTIFIENSLYNGISDGKYIGTQVEGALRIIGYRVRNNGDEPIAITRMTITNDHSTSEIILQPNQSICLSRAEMTLLGSKPEIGCDYANGKLAHNLANAHAESVYQFLNLFYFLPDNESTETESASALKKIDVYKVESQDIIDKYFVPVDHYQRKLERNKAIKQNLSENGLFAGFKR